MKGDGEHFHPNRDRLLKRLAGGIGGLFFGGISAVSAWAYITHSYFTEKVITNTTTTTILNGVSKTTTDSQVLDYGAWAPAILLGVTIAFGFIGICCLIVSIWPDQA